MNRKILYYLGALLFLVTVFTSNNVNASVFDVKTGETNAEISPDVIHTQSKFASSSTKEVVNILNVNLTNDFTKIEVGLNNPINKLARTSVLASRNNKLGHYVVGAVNASYFDSTSSPVSLIAVNNKIINYGALGTGTESPTQYPVAFGVSSTGKGIIDYYSPNMTFTVNDATYSIDTVDGERAANTTALYSSKNDTSGTNKWGMEIVVENASKDTSAFGFGDKITGTIKSIAKYQTIGDSEIPDNGFVISTTKKEVAEALQNLPVGTEISVNVGIDSKWQDAQFMLAAGPMLVKDGKVNISMATSSSFASARHPRTAVAVDATGTKVFFVTVDGRQTGYSTGTSLTDLAKYLISLGAKYAINLDGGGSTTMVARKAGSSSLSVVNSPSDKSERAVSAILQVVNTAPQGPAKSITLNSTSETLMVGNTYQPTIKSAYDIYFNPLTLAASNIVWTVEGGIGHMDGTKFVATNAGKGKLVGTSGNAKVSVDVTVKAVSDVPEILSGFDFVNEWKSQTASATASLTTNSVYAREGKASLALNYDFTSSATGTKAAYAVANTAINIAGTPDHLGVWVYGNGAKNWLRAVIVDGAGTKHTIDFTAQSKLNWSGWKYATASIPSGLTGPLKFERIYIVSPVISEYSKGTIYFDQLQAVYKANYEEPLYADLKVTNWAYSAIKTLNTAGLIKGYTNGTFKPNQQITRAEVATIIANYLNLKATTTTAFSDVAKSNYAYESIQAVAQAGIIVGREKGKFNPNDQLTRAEMSAIIMRTFKLTGTSSKSFPDVISSHWAYDSIQALLAGGYVSGYEDGTFKPNNAITRAEFASILSKVIQ